MKFEEQSCDNLNDHQHCRHPAQSESERETERRFPYLPWMQVKNESEARFISLFRGEMMSYQDFRLDAMETKIDYFALR